MTDSFKPPYDDERREALKRIRARRALATQAVTYLVVNAFLVLVWWITGPGGYFWPIWVIGGWGIGLVLSAWKVLGSRPITEEDIERELRRGRPTS
ncbi:2TM domain-containing protein [Sanguibacter antarcticus]|uniref:2TM domain-containing protein n=1 Tax=Sanguibacter antarcticus TaxID=372484 RepID=A0A2A9E4A7_9MICO|nr:2TM domain-containing protein [Sanguibacter antarcticus]PFG33019.1 2TM domain-containing protein [Sanguibacter antarcticus]